MKTSIVQGPEQTQKSVHTVFEHGTQYLFVYGTLCPTYAKLPADIREMNPPDVLESLGKWEGEASLYGYKMVDLGQYPGIISEKGNETVVKGDLFHIGDQVDMLSKLDEYEGIDPPRSEYRREITQVVLNGPSRRKVNAWVYVYNLPLDPDFIRIDNGDYLRYWLDKKLKNKTLLL